MPSKLNPLDASPPPADSPTVDESRDADATRLSAWRHPFVQNVLPFLTSTVVHLSLIVVAMIVIPKALHSIARPVHTDHFIPTEGTMLTDRPVGVSFDSSGSGDPNRTLAQDQFPDVKTSDGLNDKPSDKQAAALQSGGGGGEVASDAIIGVGPNAGSMGRGSTLGTGVGPANGRGTGEGGTSPFGIPGGGGGGNGPRSIFPPGSTNVRRIVYVCDASGSMMQKFDPLRAELRKAITGLRPPQSFNVVFFQGDGASSVGNQLLFANAEAKQKADDFLTSVSPSSSTDPLPGLRKAFAMGPQLVYLLTDGDFPDNDAVLAEIRKLSANHQVKVNTIAFMDHGEAYERVLQQIAKETGGVFRYVSEDDLGK